MPKVDFTGVSDSFEPIPAGRYDAVLTGFKLQKSKAGGDYVSLEFTVDDPEFGGRKAWQNNSLQSQALWALKRNCISLGAEPDDLSGAVDIEEVLGDLVGNDCRLDLDIREYEGKQSNGITAVLATSVD